MTFSRPSGRSADQMRAISIETDVNKYAEGSCLIGFGDTRVLVTATVEDSVPGWMRNTGKGWITAEYGMLPRSTDQRMAREAARGKQSGRTQEIQRLIGRSLRAVVDLGRLPEVQVKVDCDVIQADGGTRTASISGAYVALQLAFRHLERIGMLKQSPLTGQLAAISCGICQGTPLLDLDYDEDSAAETDANFVMVADGGIVEIQATAEETPFAQTEFMSLLALAKKGVADIVEAQNRALAA
ncbi:MAG: ribonuclease PH [Geminicoccus sp.]|nr:ribonuclease PH [Geminicoccus sp.]HCI00598.1 ribonuclease PH [Alphaproteobacteria bacterium]|tara:strand:- start:239 stop:964 length:726 start_codon:yes stop_codon:yes gene_type:complete